MSLVAVYLCQWQHFQTQSMMQLSLLLAMRQTLIIQPEWVDSEQSSECLAWQVCYSFCQTAGRESPASSVVPSWLPLLQSVTTVVTFAWPGSDLYLCKLSGLQLPVLVCSGGSDLMLIAPSFG